MRVFICYLIIILPLAATAADAPQFELTIKDHRFQPAELTIPAKLKVKLLVKNEDDTPEEFESRELNREKVVAGKSSITVYIGPLDAGTYPFFGDFHPDSAQGKLIVK